LVCRPDCAAHFGDTEGRASGYPTGQRVLLHDFDEIDVPGSDATRQGIDDTLNLDCGARRELPEVVSSSLTDHHACARLIM
jgi:hypothetical protein